MLSDGTILMNRFKIKNVLGSGGFGITYLVIDEQLQKHFALKEYFPSDFVIRKGNKVTAKTSSIDDFHWGLERFLEEARVLARFNHPNIVGVNQIFEANGTAYIVLEYQSGRSLKDWLSSIDDRPTQEELDQIAIPLLDALDTLHRNNILHRDIAPDNIYIRDDGSPVLLDFGSAREAIAARTKTVTAIYKEGFTPIEQYSTKGSGQGPWTDIYSVAATLYLLVSGEKPPEATDRIINDEIIPATRLNNGNYRHQFLEAIDWALKIQPKERPQSINEWRLKLIDTKFQNKNNIKIEEKIDEKKILNKPRNEINNASHKIKLTSIIFISICVFYLINLKKINELYQSDTIKKQSDEIINFDQLNDKDNNKKIEKNVPLTKELINETVKKVERSTSGDYSVQLAAPASEMEARSMITSLKRSYPAILDDLTMTIQKAENNGRIIFRVRAIGLSRDEAIFVCEKIKNSGGNCFVAKENFSEVNFPKLQYNSGLSLSQRVILLEEITDGQAAPAPVLGQASWSLETIRDSKGVADVAVKVEVKGLSGSLSSMSMTFKRNRDLSFPASHLIEVSFVTPEASPNGRVRDIGLPEMRVDETTRGAALFGLPVPVTDNVFLVGLTNLPDRTEVNIDLLSSRKLFVVPIRFGSGRRAALIIEKGSDGSRVLLDAFQAWK